MRWPIKACHVSKLSLYLSFVYKYENEGLLLLCEAKRALLKS